MIWHQLCVAGEYFSEKLILIFKDLNRKHSPPVQYPHEVQFPLNPSFGVHLSLSGTMTSHAGYFVALCAYQADVNPLCISRLYSQKSTGGNILPGLHKIISRAEDECTNFDTGSSKTFIFQGHIFKFELKYTKTLM